MLPESSLPYILPLVRRVLEFQVAHVIHGCLFDPGHPFRDSSTYNLINLLLYSVLHWINSVHFTFSPWVPTPCAPSGPLKPDNPGSPWQWRIIWNNYMKEFSGSLWYHVVLAFCPGAPSSPGSPGRPPRPAAPGSPCNSHIHRYQKNWTDRQFTKWFVKMSAMSHLWTRFTNTSISWSSLLSW